MANDKKLSPEQEVRSWGFTQVYTWSDRPLSHPPLPPAVNNRESRLPLPSSSEVVLASQSTRCLSPSGPLAGIMWPLLSPTPTAIAARADRNARDLFVVILSSLTRTRHLRNAHYPPHTHRELTTHLITRGELTITYPEDETPTKETHGVGARIDVDANRVHEVWVGSEGCTYVIGE